jgi:putative membrane protein
MGFDGWVWPFWGMMGGGLLMIIFWGGIIGLIIWAIVRATQPQQPPGPQSSPQTPLEIAKRRYASGEISREEFEQLKRDLS